MSIKNKIANLFSNKEEKDYDPLNLKITDIKKGFIFEYDLKTWKVEEVYEYDWGNNNFTYEYKIDSGDETAFLDIEKEDELYITISKKANIRSIDEDLPEEIIKNEAPPKKLHYQGKTYYKGKEMPGYFREQANNSEDAWIEFISWEYTDDSEEFVINIEQWDEKEFEASTGKIIKEYEISNIIPV